MKEATADSPSTRLADIYDQIAAAAKLARRAADGVTLVAVSKTRNAAEIETLIVAGQRHFGENRVQEAAEKWPSLRATHSGITLHLVGQLQSNKADEAVALFDVIHSLDRPSLAKSLGRAMRAQGKSVPCFLQVNIGNEPQKGGCAVAELSTLIAIVQDEGISVTGLMCLPPAGIEPAPFFALLADLAARDGMGDLSMGMSDDFATAIMLGATHVRIGTALFGERHRTI